MAATSIVAAWIIPLVALAVLAPIGLLIVTAALGGIAASMFDSIWETVKQTHTSPHLRARLGSFDHLGGLGLVPLGYLLGAAVIGAIGPTAGLIGGALILAGATAWIIGDRSVRDLKSKGDLTVEDHDQTGKSRLAPKVALVTAGTE